MHSLSRVAPPSDKPNPARLVVAAVVLAAAAYGVACGSGQPTPDRAVAEQPKERPETAAEQEPGVLAPIVSPESCAMEPTWPVFQGNARRTGASDAPALQNPQVRWTARVGVQSWNNNPIVVGHLVVVGSSGDVWNKPDDADGVYALDKTSGTLEWFVPFDGDVNGVAFVGCRIVAGSDDGTIRGIDPSTGKEVWTTTTSDKVYSQPLPVPGGVFMAGADAKGRLIDTVGGQVIWELDFPGPVRQGAAFDGESIWVAMTTGEVWRISPDGERQWSGTAPSRNPVWGAPTITDGGVVFGFVRDTTYGSPALAGYSFDGSPLWDRMDRGTKSNWANVRTSPAYRNGKAFHAEAYSSDIVEWDPSLGRVERVVSAGDCHFPAWGSPIVNSAQLVVPRHDGALYAVDLKSGVATWGLKLGAYTGSSESIRVEPEISNGGRCTWQPSGSKPLFATPAIDRSGALYVGSGGGWLFAIGSADDDK